MWKFFSSHSNERGNYAKAARKGVFLGGRVSGNPHVDSPPRLEVFAILNVFIACCAGTFLFKEPASAVRKTTLLELGERPGTP